MIAFQLRELASVRESEIGFICCRGVRGTEDKRAGEGQSRFGFPLVQSAQHAKVLCFGKLFSGPGKRKVDKGVEWSEHNAKSPLLGR